MNKVILIGRPTTDPEVNYTTGDNPTAVAKFNLAVNRKVRRDGEPEADFIRCVAFGKNGEFAEKYVRKGVKIAVEGRIQTGSYTNRDGQRVYTTDVVVEGFDFADRLSSSGSEGSGPAPVTDGDGFMNIKDEEMPFN